MNETAARPFHAQFQTFDDPPEAAQAAQVAPRVAALRAELKARGPAQPDGLPDTTLALLR